jgi:hypothetical protein
VLGNRIALGYQAHFNTRTERVGSNKQATIE